MGSAKSAIRRAPLRNERGDEGFFEIEDVNEVVDRIGLLAAEHLLFDEKKDHFADVAGASEAPFRHERSGHGAEFLESEIAEAEKKFLTGDVAGLSVVALGRALEREVERVLEKKVGVGVESLVALENALDGVFELRGLHVGI